MAEATLSVTVSTSSSLSEKFPKDLDPFVAVVEECKAYEN